MQTALLMAQAAALLWTAVIGLGSPVIGVGTAVAVLGSLGLGWLRPRLRCVATLAGLLMSCTGLVVLSIQSSSPALLPAVLLTMVVVVGILVEERRQPASQDIQAELSARVDELAATKDQLLAVVSHEFRTPVTGVMGFAKTISNHFGTLDQDTMQLFVRSIEDHSTRLARLVDNLVVASDEIAVDLVATCDVHGVITSVVSGVSTNDHEVQVSLRGGRVAQISADAARRVVTNLVDNALKFSDPETLVRIEARPAGGDLVVDVINTGPPLPADLREHLYQPFVQADSSDSRRADGLGLGLHVVRRLVEAHGGRVDLVEGGGLVTFRVRLRAVAALQEAGARVVR